MGPEDSWVAKWQRVSKYTSHLLVFYTPSPLRINTISQGCQFSDFSLISDFFRIKETVIKLIKYGQNMDKISKVSKDMLDSGKRIQFLNIKTSPDYLQTKLFQIIRKV